ncbi:cytochrome P450 7A1-like [Petromyzon marinus]|uniref:cytochrome P450 7A1-like n=1 Tax=Petromyzon marinus TaxID=7757 RepID=UPI003F7231EE
MALLVAWSLFLTLLFTAWLFGGRRRRANEAPLVRSWVPYLGSALRYGAQPLAFLREQQARYGEVFTCLIAGSYTTFICDPFSYGALLRNDRALDFEKFGQKIARTVFGVVDFFDPRYNVTIEEIHDIFAKTLTGTELHSLTESMLGNLHGYLVEGRAARDAGAGCAGGAGGDGWQEEGLNEFCRRTMFRAGVATIFGQNMFDAESSLAEMLKSFDDFDRAFPLLVAGVPLWMMPAARRGREALETALGKVAPGTMVEPAALIMQRANLFEGSPLLGKLDKARTHSIMMWASQANSLPAIFWTLFYLLRSAPALKAVRAQLKELLGHEAREHGKAFVITREQLNKMTVLHSVVNEALRLSSASMIVRQAKEDVTLELDSGRSVLVRKGDMVALYPKMMHFDPSIYPDPMEFKFDRFLGENLKEKTTFTQNSRRLSLYLMPFGMGKSLCPGRFFAINEMKLVVTMLLWSYDLELLDPGAASPPLNNARAGLGILPPMHDVKFRYRFKGQVLPSL